MSRYYSRMTPVAWTYHADVYCAQCAESLPEVDPEGNEKYPVFSWETSEWTQEIDGEYVPHCCGKCGEPSTEW